MLRTFLAGLVTLILFFFVADNPHAFAQVTTADIVGTVTDNSGAVVPGAKVTITNLDTEAPRQTQTDASGAYVVSLLPIGRYSVRVEANGFKAFTVASTTLASGDRARVDAQMQVGEMSQTVEVQAQTPALQTDSSSQGSTVTERAVQDLPLNGRNFTVLAQLAPGTNAGSPSALSSGTRPDDRRQTATIAVGAQGSQVNNYMVDGMDNNDRAIGTAILRPSIDALAEMRVQTSLFTAEVGRVSGGVINLLTKSGTNEFHGTLYEYFRNDKLDSRSFFTLAKPEYRQNQFGGSLGGPIIKNKTFFFADYEGFRQVQGQPYTASVPTAAMKAGNFNGVAPVYNPSTLTQTAPGVYSRTLYPNDTIPASAFNPIALNYLNLYPAPNQPGLANNYISAFAKTQNYSTFDTRVDQHFSDRDLLYGRYSFNDTTSFLPGNLPVVNGIQPGGSTAYPGASLQRAQGAYVDYVHIFSPSLLLELKAGWVRYGAHTQPLNFGDNVSQQFGIPYANHSSTSSGLTQVQPAGYDSLGDAQYLPIIQIDNTFQYMGAFTYSTGSHNMKFGAGVIRRQFTQAQGQSPKGTIAFTAAETNNGVGVGGYSIASLLLGAIDTDNLIDNPVFPGYRMWEPSAYFQDDWRVSSRLTLNVGVRYDIFTPYTEVANRISNLNLTTFKVDVPGQNGVSSTAGVRTYYDDLQPRLGFAFQLGHGTVLRGGYGLSFIPGQYMSQSFLKNPPFVSTQQFTNSAPYPFALSLSNPFTPPVLTSINPVSGNLSGVNDYNLHPTYTHMLNIQLQKEIFGSVLGVAYVGELTRKLGLYPNIDQPDPGIGPVQPRRPYYSVLPLVTAINYVADAGTLNYHSMQVTFEHRYSHGLVLGGNYTWAHALGSSLTGNTPAVESNWNLEYTNSSLDVRHRVILTANYSLPFGQSARGFSKALIAGWQLNGIFVFQTGLPFTVTNNSQRANVGATGNPDRPNRVARGTLSNPSISEWFDVNAFVGQPLYTAGNAAPYLLYGPDQRHLDLSLFKNFPIRENYRIQFRAESYNLTNTASFANPNSALGNAAFGTISSTLGTPRQIQLALKLLF